MPELEAFWQMYKSDQLLLIGVDQGEDSAVVEEFARGVVDTTFPLLLDQRTDVGVIQIQRDVIIGLRMRQPHDAEQQRGNQRSARV